MKKKIFLSLLTTILFFTCFVCVRAAESTYVPTTTSKAMDSVLDDDYEISAVMDDHAFPDFTTYVKFTTKTGNGKITPTGDLSAGGLTKILITGKPNYEAGLDITASAATLVGTDKSYWFTAYCLDGSKQYPHFGIQNILTQKAAAILNASHTLDDATKQAIVTQITAKTTQQGTAAGLTQEQINAKIESQKEDLGLNNNKLIMADQLLGAATVIALENNRKFYDLLKEKIATLDTVNGIKITYRVDPSDSSDIVFDGANLPATTPTNLSNALGAAPVLQSLKAAQSVNVYIVSAQVLGSGEGTPTITAAELVTKDSDNAAGETYKLSFDYKDILFDKYFYTPIKKDDNTYNHALWIIEHSYPSLSMSEFLGKVGVSVSDYEAAIMGLYPADMTFTEAQKASILDNFLYYTVQYAIWKANGYTTADDAATGFYELGDTLEINGDGGNILDKIYKYLIQDRAEYTNYNSNANAYDHTKIQCANCSSGSVDVSESKDYYTYGPYKASYNVINPSDITIEVTGTNKDKVKIVDKEGNEINKIVNGGEFYVKTKRSDKIADTTVKLSAEGTTYGSPNTEGVIQATNDKGTIYYANFPGSQNVITGQLYANVAASTEFPLTYNPKTGVPNIAIVFIITLIAFSLGYLALSYNNKSIELN